MARKKKSLTPAAFLSYVRFDDKHEDGKISEIRERLCSEVRAQTGEEFPIFQDRNDIHWGENWESRIENELDTSTFLIPIITPSFFKSPSCRKELEGFLKREEQLKRNDLVLPIYYIEVDLKKARRDPLLKMIFKHQYADWREMRFELTTSPQFSRSVAQLATDLRDAISRSSKPRRPRTDLRKNSGRTRGTIAEREEIVRAEDIRERATQVAETALPSEKSEPRIRLVDISGQGEFVNVHDAVARAAPGDRILIRPGVYQENSLLIDKPLELIGDGSLGEVILRGEDENVIDFKTILGRLSNLRIEHKIAGRRRGHSNYALLIRQGKLETENCQIVTDGATCVAISTGADPRLRNLQIRSPGIGVLFSGGRGSLEDSDVYSTDSTAMSLASSANPTVRRNRIHTDTGGLTIQVFHDATGLLESNDIAGGINAVDVKWGGNPTLRSNVIHNARDCGVNVDEGGEGLFENNQIVNNTKVGMRVGTDGKPTVRGNKIIGQNIGIEISNASGIFEKNDLRGNSMSAWKISADSLAKIVRSENLE